MDLLLEQILERLPRVQWSSGSRRLSGNLGRLHIGSWCSILLYRGPELVKRAVILGILRGDSCRDCLRALELRSAVKEPALLTAMELETALGTFSKRVKARHQHRPAIRTAGSRYRADHPWGARPEMIGRATRSTLRRFPLPVLLLASFLFFGITIAAVTVLAIHKRLRPSVATDCNCGFLSNFLKSSLFPRCIQSERYKRPAHQSSPLKLFWNAV